MRSVFEIMANNIVNPRCDECGSAVRPRDPLLGPHLCYDCQARSTAECNARFRDWQTQERRRRIHVVKLPEGM